MRAPEARAQRIAEIRERLAEYRAANIEVVDRGSPYSLMAHAADDIEWLLSLLPNPKPAPKAVLVRCAACGKEVRRGSREWATSGCSNYCLPCAYKL